MKMMQKVSSFHKFKGENGNINILFEVEVYHIPLGYILSR